MKKCCFSLWWPPWVFTTTTTTWWPLTLGKIICGTSQGVKVTYNETIWHLLVERGPINCSANYQDCRLQFQCGLDCFWLWGGENGFYVPSGETKSPIWNSLQISEQENIFIWSILHLAFFKTLFWFTLLLSGESCSPASMWGLHLLPWSGFCLPNFSNH